MAQEMLAVTVQDALVGTDCFVEAGDNHAYTGAKIDGSDSLDVQNDVWHGGADDPEATSEFASFDLGDVSDGGVWAFARHDIGADVGADGPRISEGLETMFVRIEDGEATEISQGDI